LIEMQLGGAGPGPSFAHEIRKEDVRMRENQALQYAGIHLDEKELPPCALTKNNFTLRSWRGPKSKRAAGHRALH
jgi:hypothetical protein